MSDLSRRSSRRPLLPDESSSLTSFPDPSTAANALSHEEESTNQPLHGLLDTSGPSMFDENAAFDNSSPQALSAAQPAVLQSIIDHHGAADLVRRLSTLLAERDAHITALTRLAEEFDVPKARIADTASRVKQQERRRLSLAAASEDLLPSSAIGSDSSGSQTVGNVLEPPSMARGITKLFGGGGGKRKDLKSTPASSRSTSRPPPARERPQSIDVQSFHSHHSSDTMGWTAAGLSLFTSNGSKPRADSQSSRLPVEMTTRRDKDQLPPTLSNHAHAQDPQEAEWNRYMVRLSEMRHENGEEANSTEIIGASRFGQEGSAGQRKMEQLTRLLIGGVPMHFRHPIWMELSGTQSFMHTDEYAYYLSLRDSEDLAELDAILKDVPRTLTSKYDFYAGKGFKRLKQVLVAFVGKYQHLGYTQGLNTIAGYLLLAIPTEEDAFWMLCNIVENFFPQDYFSRNDAMVSPLADNVLLRQYVKEYMPQLNAHLDDLEIKPDHTVPLKWFFTAFSSALPEAIVMRVWDIWLCLPTQKHFLFGFALALLHQNAEGIMECEESSAYFSYVDNKLKLPEDATQLNELMKQAFKASRKLENVAERRTEEVEKLKATIMVDSKRRLRKSQSLEVLVDRAEDGTTASEAATAEASHE